MSIQPYSIIIANNSNIDHNILEILLSCFNRLTSYLEQNEYLLRIGNDTELEKNISKKVKNKSIFLTKHITGYSRIEIITGNAIELAEQLASEYGYSVNGYNKAIFGAYIAKILGSGLNLPSDFLIVFNGSNGINKNRIEFLKEIANKYDIPTFDFSYVEDVVKFIKYSEKNFNKKTSRKIKSCLLDLI